MDNRRLVYLREQHGAALLDAVRTERRNARHLDFMDGQSSSNVVEVVFLRYREADPTDNGACTQWLIRLALDGKLPLEDLPKAKETLEAFLTYKRRLEPEDRDLGRHETLGSVWRAVEPFVRENAVASTREEDRRKRAAARAESTILLEQDGWTVAIPRTERAAKWWGRGTRWCTAADRNNQFDNYNEDGPLVVIVRPDGAKFQWHGQSDQCMNAEDEEAAPGRIVRDLPERLTAPQAPGETEENCLLRHGFLVGMLRQSRRLGSLIAEGRIVPGAARTALTTFGILFDELPERLRSYDLCLEAVREDGEAIAHVPARLRTPALCLEAVRRSAEALGMLPERLRTYDLCLEAVRHHGDALFDVPKPLRDRVICRTAMKTTTAYNTLSVVPKEFVDAEMCRLAVRANGNALSIVPGSIIDRDLCLEAVRHEPDAIEWVPRRFMDRDMILEAVRGNGFALDKVPPSRRDREVCLAAVTRTPYAIGAVPRSAPWWREVALAALSLNGSALGAVPPRARDGEICLAAVRQDPFAFDKVPKKIQSADFCTELVLERISQGYRHPFRGIPDKLIPYIRHFVSAASRTSPEPDTTTPLASDQNSEVDGPVPA